MIYKGKIDTLYTDEKFQDGDIVYALDTEKFYLYTEKNGWLHLSNFSEDTLEKIQKPQYCSMEIVDDGSGSPTQLSTISLYELNKQIISQLPNYGEEEIQKAKELIKQYDKDCGATYYMLLSNEMRYYTIFSCGYGDMVDTFHSSVIDCLNAIGPIKSIEKNNDGVIEIWCFSIVDEELHVFYLFPYDEGVVPCR